MKYAFLVLLLLFSGCATRSYDTHSSKLVTIKTANFAYSDVGFVRSGKSGVELEIFSAGVSLDRISINRLICTTKDGCMPKGVFNAKYLNGAYYDDLLSDLLLHKPIYGGANLIKNGAGFVQRISDESVEIYYEVSSRSMSFRDPKNGIMIKIKDLDE
jgi:hypothetical protein